MKATIILVVLCWLPIVAFSQTYSVGKTSTTSSKPILKGLYFGVQIAPFVASSLRHKIPYDTATRSFVSAYKSEYTKIKANQPIIFLNAKIVICKWLTIDLHNVFRAVKGTITFSEYRSYGGLQFLGPSSYLATKEVSSLNLINNNFTINPNITFDIEDTKLFFGLGYGKSKILSRTGSLDRKYSFKRSSELYQINVGYSVKFRKGIVTGGITHGWSSEMASSNWKAHQRYTLLSIGYALPLFTIKQEVVNPPTL